MAAEGRPRSGREAPLMPSTVQASGTPVESRCVNTLARLRERVGVRARFNPNAALHPREASERASSVTLPGFSPTRRMA